MFTFTLLTPPDGSESCKASLMTIDNDIKILSDPTWNSKNHNDINFLEDYLQDVNIILLSHSTPEFIGGFMLLCIKFPKLMNNIRIYATSAVSQLGKVSTVEFYRSLGIVGPLQDALMEVSDVDEWFDKINGLKYFETTSVMDKLIITPYNSGHTLGGSFWLIQRKLEKIIYAPSWNHSKDSFLNGASFLSSSTGNPISQLMRPTALITGSDLGSNLSHKKRIGKFLQLVDATLSNGGTVLLPTSISGRFLEILNIIDEHLQSAPIPVLFLSYSGTNVLRYATNLLEWMSSKLSKELENANSLNANATNRSHYPFDPSKVDLVNSTYELTQVTGPKVIFTSGVDIKNGELSSDALRYLCQDEKTTIILTEKAHLDNDDSTISNQLYNEWYNLCKSKNDNKVEDGFVVPLEKTIQLKEWTLEEELVGGELNEYREKVNFKRKQKLVEQVRDRKNKNLLTGEDFDGESSSDDDEEDDEEQDENQQPGDETEDIENGGETNQMEDIQTNGNETEPKENGTIKEEIKSTVNLMDDAGTQEALVAENIKTSFEQNLPLDIKITNKLRARNAMFPFFPNRSKQDFDDYGAIINVKDFEKKDEIHNPLGLEPKIDDRRNWGVNQDDELDNLNNTQNKLTPQEILNNDIIKKNLDSLFQPRKRIPITPNSVVVTAHDPLKLNIKCGLSYVDLSGLVDLRSFSLIVSSLKPSNLLLLPDTISFNGEEDGITRIKNLLNQQTSIKNETDSKDHLLESAKYLSLKNIRTGNISQKTNKMEIIDIKANDSIKIGNEDDSMSYGDFEVKLDESISKNLQWQTIDGSYRIAQIIGQLEVSNNKISITKSDSKKRKINQILNQSSEFSLKKFNLDQLDPSRSIGGGSKIAIGNIRLPELKKKLLEKNLNAEFKGEGTLVVNELVSIRKVTYGNGGTDDTGDIVINGQFGPLYYQVKECIRDMLAYV